MRLRRLMDSSISATCCSSAAIFSRAVSQVALCSLEIHLNRMPLAEKAGYPRRIVVARHHVEQEERIFTAADTGTGGLDLICLCAFCCGRILPLPLSVDDQVVEVVRMLAQ